MKKIFIGLIMVIALASSTFAKNYELLTNEENKTILKAEIDRDTYYAFKKILCKSDPVSLNGSKYLIFKNFSVDFSDSGRKADDKYFINVYVEDKNDYASIIKQDEIRLSIPQVNPDGWDDKIMKNNMKTIYLKSDYIYIKINKKYLENVKEGYEYKTYLFTEDKEKIEIPLCIEEEIDNGYVVRTLEKYKKYIYGMINSDIKIQTEDETKMPYIWCDTTLRIVKRDE